MGESQSLSNFSEGGVAPTELLATTPTAPRRGHRSFQKPAHGTGAFPIADLDPQGIEDRDHSQGLKSVAIDGRRITDRLTILNVVVPPLDLADEWFD